MENKKCIDCKKTKDISEFFYRNKKKGYKQSRCKKCLTRVNNEYRKDNKEKIQLIKKREYRKNEGRYRDYNLKRTYGISLEDYNKTLEKQEGNCYICKSKKTTRKNNRLDVDHCHKTGKVRGLLCSYCNSLIGNCKESIDILQNAIEYLEYHR